MVRLARLLGSADAAFSARRGPRHTAFFVDVALGPSLSQSLLAPAAVPHRACDRKALLRGFFLVSGSVNAPSSRYHLELAVADPDWARVLRDTLTALHISARLSLRAGQPLVYVKDGDGVVRMLSLMGASRSVMHFESTRVMREVRGGVNRRLNFETANLDKTVGSAQRQLNAIDRLDRMERLERLPGALRQVARARRAQPEGTLGELAQRLRISKSAVNHRLRRLEREARQDVLPPPPVERPYHGTVLENGGSGRRS